MKKHTFETKIAAALGAALFLALAAPATAQNGYGPGRGLGTAVAVQPLVAAEAQWMKLMREEEKLARDVYQQLYQKWNLPVFHNIAASEQTHFNTIGVLLARYTVADPAQNTAAGVFADAGLNSLYNQLLAKGMRSVQDALEVGVAIEKKDIADLETALKGTTKLDLKRVYTNLMDASYNHLEAFETGCLLTAAAVN